MRYALLDNATLTGVQRILGSIQVRNRMCLDNDLLCLENYIQSILFYDDLICIDDYKQEYRERRKAMFSNIKFISPDLFDYDEFVAKSLEITSDISLQVKGGNIDDKDFSSFFQRMGMDFIFTWDVSSSKYFLTQKMLLDNPRISVKNFGKIHSTLFLEKNEQYESIFQMENKEPLLFSGNGNLFYGIDEFKRKNKDFSECEGDGFSFQFESFVSSLNWLSQRTAFYALTAEYLKADIFIHPLRQNFLTNITNRIYYGEGLGPLHNTINSLNSKAKGSIKEILNSSQMNLSFDIPLFSAYIVNQTKDVSNVIEYAYELRDQQDFFEARNKLREISKILTDKGRGKYVKAVNKLNIELDQLFNKIKTKYYVDNQQGIPLSNLLFFFTAATGVKVSLPKFLDPKIPQLEFLKHISRNTGLKGVYKNLINDLVGMERLGRYKDLLLSNVKYHKDVSSWGIKTEDVKFRNYSGFWKKPMK